MVLRPYNLSKYDVSTVTVALLSAFRREQLLSNGVILNGNVLLRCHISNFIPIRPISIGISWTEIELE